MVAHVQAVMFAQPVFAGDKTRWSARMGASATGGGAIQQRVAVWQPKRLTEPPATMVMHAQRTMCAKVELALEEASLPAWQATSATLRAFAILVQESAQLRRR